MNRVFLIDDEPIFNLINQKILQIAKYADQVLCYSDAAIALSELKQLSDSNKEIFPEAIFLDINMPGMDGWEFLDEFNKIDEQYRSGCKVYVLTSSIDPLDIDKSKSYDIVHDFISKPLTLEKLAKMI